MENAIKHEVDNQISYLGQSEFLLAVNRVEDASDVKTIVEFITEHRRQFEAGRVTSNGCASFATKETYQAIAAESDAAAKRELLKSSALLFAVDALTRKAEEARKAAEAKERELNLLWQEYSALPNKISTAQRELDSINDALKDLDPEKLHNEFKRHFRLIIDGSDRQHVFRAH